MTEHAAGTPSIQRPTPYAWVVLAMLTFIYVFNFLDRQLMSTLIESIKRDTGFTDAEMGYMTGFWFALVYTTFGVAVGFLADRTSRRNIIVVGCVLWSGFTALCGMATSYPMMLAARVGVGIGEAGGAPPSYSIISDYFPPEKRGMALALFSLGVPFGQALAVAFGSQIDLMFGWRAAFIGIGIAGAAAAIVTFFVVREPKRGAMDPPDLSPLTQEQSGFLETFWQFVSRPVLLWTALSCGVTALITYAALNWNVAFLRRALEMKLEDVGIWYALLLAVALGLGTWISGVLVDFLAKRSRTWYALMPAIAFTLAAPFWYFYTQATDWQTALWILSVPTFLTIFYLAPALALVSNSVRPSQRTMASAIFLLVLNFIGLGCGPTLVGVLSTAFSSTHLQASLGATAADAETYMKMPAAELANLDETLRVSIASASSEGLRDALVWILPFFGLAIALLLLQALAIRKETSAGKPVRDAGRRLGIVLLAAGAGGLGVIAYSSGAEGLTPKDLMSAISLVLAAGSTLIGCSFLVSSFVTPPKPYSR